MRPRLVFINPCPGNIAHPHMTEFKLTLFFHAGQSTPLKDIPFLFPSKYKPAIMGL